MENIITDSISLRKLTEKSTLLFGKYRECKVQDLINSGQKQYLKWVYYNCSMITFNDEILEILKITPDRMIKKPGVNREYYKEFMDQYNTKVRGIESIVFKAKIKKRLAAKDAQRRARGKIKYSRNSMQWKNQGH